MAGSVAVVLAAGKGTRMKSDLPKVLVPVLGRPMLEYVLDALAEAGVERTIVVVGYRAELVESTLDGRYGVEFVLQSEQLGTGHAVMMCRSHLAEHNGPVLVLAGDSPLTQSSSLAQLLEEFQREPAACILGTAENANPAGLGRVVRDSQGNFLGIVEQKDATPEQLRITEVNMSTYVFNCRDLLGCLDRLRADNAQREYYITDVPGMLVADRRDVRAMKVLKPCEALSINTFDELAVVEEVMREMTEGEGSMTNDQ